MRGMKAIAMCLAIMLTPMAMGAEGCENPPPDTSGADDRPPQDRVVNPATAASVQILAYVEDEFSPYTVTVVARELGASGSVTEDSDVPVAGGFYRQELKYTSGVRIRIFMTVKPGKPGSKQGYCKIVDGVDHVNEMKVAGGWRAFCELTTSR